MISPGTGVRILNQLVGYLSGLSTGSSMMLKDHSDFCTNVGCEERGEERGIRSKQKWIGCISHT